VVVHLAVGAGDGDGSVRVDLQPPSTFVHHVVVSFAQRYQPLQIGRPAVTGPLSRVVDLAVAEAVSALTETRAFCSSKVALRGRVPGGRLATSGGPVVGAAVNELGEGLGECLVFA
jgi:hypothetical protein